MDAAELNCAPYGMDSCLLTLLTSLKGTAKLATDRSLERRLRMSLRVFTLKTSGSGAQALHGV